MWRLAYLPQSPFGAGRQGDRQSGGWVGDGDGDGDGGGGDGGGWE